MIALTRGDFAYNFFYLLHILAIIVGFGSTFVWPVLAAKARRLGDPKSAYAMNKAGFDAGKVLTTPFVWSAGAFGVILVAIGEWEFSQQWISIAFLLFFVAALFALFVHTPNLKKMLELQERLAAGEAKPPAGGGPPPEVEELQARGKRAGMYGGLLHLLFLLLVIDMIWKPGT